MFATKVFMLELGGLKLVTGSCVFTVFDFHQVDVALLRVNIFWVSKKRSHHGDPFQSIADSTATQHSLRVRGGIRGCFRKAGSD